jgi:hypothetical protein
VLQPSPFKGNLVPRLQVEGVLRIQRVIAHALSLKGQKVRIVGAKEVLSLPCGFFFGMTAPWDVVEVNHPSLCDPLLLIQWLHRMLGIGQIRFKRCDITDANMSGCLQTFLELGYMKHIMGTCQRWQQPQLVSHDSKLL